MDSILLSVRKIVLENQENSAFDTDIIMLINTAFSVLSQMGMGPSEGFVIADDSKKWTDYLKDTPTLEMVKTYVTLSVKVVFDPPNSAAVLNSLNAKIDKYEWLIKAVVDKSSEMV